MFAPEKLHDVEPCLVEQRASMRPGHVCPGKKLEAVSRLDLVGASMRPGHVCPGNTRPETNSANSHRLQ